MKQFSTNFLRVISGFTFAALLTAGASAHAQAWPPAPYIPDAPKPQAQAGEPVTLRAVPTNFVKDQGAIWTSPIRVRERELKYLIPLGLATTVAITADHQTMSDVVSRNQDFNHKNVQVSNALTGGLLGAPVVFFAAGQFGGNPHARETGILAGEAVLNGLVVEQGIKLMTWRERPSVDGAKGKFWQSSAGWDSSFPSSHSLLVWSSAAVMAEEYPSWWMKTGVYTLATGVILTRVLGQQHFPSDVLVGSAFGWMVGHYVYKKHHHWHPDSR
ncbi:MAG TPA: phosphatase PAP2 family protein, partial [Terriglobia bacterium]|nr:phosphatase PAP2 family protein [Terriglobia bacterium]